MRREGYSVQFSAMLKVGLASDLRRGKGTNMIFAKSGLTLDMFRVSLTGWSYPERVAWGMGCGEVGTWA